MNLEKEPLVTIIIINYNGKPYLKKCLKSIEQTTYKNYEIVLVDNNSTDESVDFVEKNFPDIKVIKLDKNYGFAEPNNIAAKQSKGDLFYFLNNDTEICSNSLSELVTAIKKPDIAIGQSLLLKENNDIDSSGDYFTKKGLVYSSTKKENKVKTILSARGASMIVKKEAFWKLGGFDTKFFASFEDVDLGWRAWIGGYKVVLVPNSIVYHLGGGTTKELESEINFHGVKNTLILCLTNFEFLYSIQSISSLFKLMLKNFFFHRDPLKTDDVKFKVPQSGSIVKALVWILKNLGYIIKKRNKVKSFRVVSTKELLENGLIQDL